MKRLWIVEIIYDCGGQIIPTAPYNGTSYHAIIPPLGEIDILRTSANRYKIISNAQKWDILTFKSVSQLNEFFTAVCAPVKSCKAMLNAVYGEHAGGGDNGSTKEN